MTFVYTSSSLMREFVRLVPFTRIVKKIKYIAINLIKGVRCLYRKNIIKP